MRIGLSRQSVSAPPTLRRILGERKKVGRLWGRRKRMSAAASPGASTKVWTPNNDDRLQHEAVEMAQMVNIGQYDRDPFAPFDVT